MPTIEVLPHTGPLPNTTPGWAYVLEPAIDPSKAPLILAPTTHASRAPTGKRTSTRTAATAEVIAGAANAVSKRAEAKVRARIEALGREPAWQTAGADVPKRPKAGRPATPNVKRVLGSVKRWEHHAADEEARIASGGGVTVGLPPAGAEPEKPPAPVKGVGRGRRTDLIRKRNMEAAKAAAAGGQKVPEMKITAKGDSSGDVVMVDAPSSSAITTYVPTLPPTLNLPKLEPAGAALLSIPRPASPSEDDIRKLVSAPAKPWFEARAQPPKERKPIRRFCEQCGYWGRVKCLRCGEFVCSLVCKMGHEAGTAGCRS